MGTAGFFLTGAGFIVGAYFLVLDKVEVHWPGFLLGMAIGISGVAVLRLNAHKRKTHSGRLLENVAVLEESLKRIVENINELESRKGGMNVYDLGAWIDEKFPDEIERFVNARESIAYAYSLTDYAAVMNPFAAGERHLNRVWSCSVDGYVDEAHASIARSRERFLAAREKLASLRR
ncbi:MAG: hypothetical protein JW793_13630 [Acidobacteria bacterium]|nr:hypothetical protein [Acidobacteriota bacterium]